MPESTVVADVERFILEELALGTVVERIAPDEDLLGSGIVDSHGVVELLSFLAARYGLEVSDADMRPENFQTLQHIEAFVARKRR
mgnify:CR=1 FL=1